MHAIPLLRLNEQFEYKFGQNWIKCKCNGWYQTFTLETRYYILQILDEKFIGSFPFGVTAIEEKQMTGRVKREPNQILKDLIDTCV